MAASGSQTIQLYYSTSSGAVPVNTNLANGELAININDGKLYYKDSGGTVQTLATKGTAAIGGSNTQVQYNNGGALAGSGNLTFDGTTLTAGGFSGPLNGSVGATTPNTGAFTNLSSSGTVSGTGFSNYLASPPAIGGTTPAAGSFTTLSASGNVTLSGGTANGVLYLNGSKVATSGSALTYNGTTLTVVNNASAVSIGLSRTSATARDYALGVDGDGGFRLTDSTGSVVVLSSLPSIAFLASAGDLYFKANNTEQMRLTSTGLGIGTSSPSQRLHVTGSSSATTVGTAATIQITSSTGLTFPAGDVYLQAVIDSATPGDRGTALAFFTGRQGVGITERARIDSLGNLGLGVTPSNAYSGLRSFEIGANGVLYSETPTGIYNSMSVGLNFYYDAAGTAKYKNSSLQASRYNQYQGQHQWFTAASGTAGNAITFTQAMTLDANGNLLVGATSSAAGKAVIKDNSSGNNLWLIGRSSDGTSSISFRNNADSAYNARIECFDTGVMTFGTGTSATERARIDSSGRVCVGGTTVTDGHLLNIQGSTASNNIGIVLNKTNATAQIWGITNTGPLAFYNYTASSEAMRIDTSGNLGIGTSSPTAGYRASIKGNYSSIVGGIEFDNGGGDKTVLGFASATSPSFIISNQSASGVLRFDTNNTERARIDSSGNLLVGATSSAANSGTGVKLLPSGYVYVVAPSTTSDTYNYYNSTAGAYRFYVTNAGVINATSTTITAISDQRLKENIQDIDVGLDAVMALKPRKFDWKAGKGKDKKGDRGWIAQEFEQVFPDMITTWKDEPPEGEEPYKAVNADLIPVLVKAIQEQQAIIEQLKADVAALKGA